MRTLFGLTLAGLVALTAGAGARATLLHDHDGPHKGIVVEWGDEEYHPELVIDGKAGTVTAYIYGGEDDLKKAKVKPIDAKTLILSLKTTPPTTIKMDAAPDKGDPAGKSSKFVGKSEVFTKEMKWAGTLTGKIGTKPYSGDFKQK